MIVLAFAPVYVIVYCILLQGFNLFFRSGFIPWRNVSFRSIAVLLFTCVAVAILLHFISDTFWNNRFQHALGGGFIAYLVCFLAATDSKVRMSRFQFAILGVLIVTSLGVANEILEFFLQNYLGLLMAASINDTWLDLISNTVGATVGLTIFGMLFKAR